jgi:hypothetical protein
MKRSFLRSLIAGALIWVAINMVASAYQPAHTGSAIAAVEIGLALLVAIIACFLLRWP